VLLVVEVADGNTNGDAAVARPGVARYDA